MVYNIIITLWRDWGLVNLVFLQTLRDVTQVNFKWSTAGLNSALFKFIQEQWIVISSRHTIIRTVSLIWWTDKDNMPGLLNFNKIFSALLIYRI